MAEGCHRLRRTALLAALAVSAVAAGGCAPMAPRPSAEGASPESSGGPAGGLNAAASALIVQGRNERRAGDYARASATLERALRVEPTAPAIWLELARVRLLQKDYAQAEQLARKAQSLAGSDAALRAESGDLIAHARREQGRNPGPAVPLP